MGRCIPVEPLIDGPTELHRLAARLVEQPKLHERMVVVAGAGGLIDLRVPDVDEAVAAIRSGPFALARVKIAKGRGIRRLPRFWVKSRIMPTSEQETAVLSLRPR